jgi:hypothetical protein
MSSARVLADDHAFVNPRRPTNIAPRSTVQQGELRGDARSIGVGELGRAEFAAGALALEHVVELADCGSRS